MPLYAAVLWASLNTASSAEAIRTFDSMQSSALFQVGMRLPIPVSGQFPRVDGEILPMPDNQIRVRVHLDARSLKMSGQSWIQSLTHSADFLDTTRYPDIVFISAPIADTVLATGGRIQGQLSLRGQSRPVDFQMRKSSCQAPGIQCPIEVNGQLSRRQFGINAYRLSVRDTIQFRFQLKLRHD
jgi:polyisoprenoid-binding protein YceI